ncbi:MAG TPA: hypothetical protein PK020_07600 [Ilumatobacteraceae bacterium]|nr:hypothetical protein [Ilumatobacteraceae bacterium]HRB03110.1 hypothetical protein [Ilumatobacteraceae bacterium]
MSGSAAQNRNKTITSLTTAITPGWWNPAGTAPTGSNGKKIFDELHNAVQDLAKITNPATQQALRDLLAMTRRWGTNAINDAIARGASSNNIAQATSKIVLGDDKAAHNNPGDAVDAYRNAWTAATNAT